MRVYEELFIVRPDVPDEDVDHLVEQVANVSDGRGCNIDKVDRWGKRKLAYRIGKYREGNYILLQFSAKPETVKEVERRSAGERPGDQVHDRAHRRNAEAHREAQEAAGQEGRTPSRTCRTATVCGTADVRSSGETRRSSRTPLPGQPPVRQRAAPAVTAAPAAPVAVYLPRTEES